MSDKKVYEAIASVTAALSKQGIAKDQKNEQQGYKFRGIDSIYNALAPFLAEAKLCILPNVLEREVVERTSAKGTALFYVTVKVDFAFVSAEDCSEHHVVTYGEAMDTGDKATNKAMSAAYKYAAMQAFCIPTEGDNDADNKTHEVKAAPSGSARQVTVDAFKKLPLKRQHELTDLSIKMIDLLNEGKDWEAYNLSQTSNLDADDEAGLWSLFNSQQRRAMKDAKHLEAATQRKLEIATQA